MVSLAKSGKHVVRLKGGDPMIFGRADEEIDACRAGGIPVEVVPGISTAQAAASRLGVSLTHRRDARRVQFVTAHAENGSLPDNLDWASIADPAATTAVYMPGRTIAEFAQHAITNGLDADTPAVAVAALGRAGEKIVKATLGDIASRLQQETLPTPLLVLIGRTLDRVERAGMATAMRAHLGALAAPGPTAGPPQENGTN
jgi:uroporphyrin-III C-methyltransferase / precorrin-2 dehydrogenase / sirohydrochlorin ferrochelatase